MSSNPVPKNIEQVKILDTYMKDLAFRAGGKDEPAIRTNLG